MMDRARRLLAMGLAAGLGLAPACRYSFVVDSGPPGAEVYVDGVAKGKTPCEVSEKPGFARTAWISLRRPGFKPKHVEATESEIYHPTAAVVGVWYLVVPVIVWAAIGAPGPSRLKPYYYFELEPEPEPPAPAPRPVPRARP